MGEQAKIKLGPVLNGIEGRKAGTIEGFNYSRPTIIRHHVEHASVR